MRLFYLILILQVCHFNILNGNKIHKSRSKLFRDYSNTIVETRNGQVAGLVSNTVDKGIPYVSYKGIPFAEPPIGDLRFRPPVPSSNWTSVREAYNDPQPCTQGIPITGSEDCLYVNVYKPLLDNNTDLLPVLVWIYGGGFIGGDSSYNSFGPDFLLNENLIFVSFNYRLGVFGFLSTEDLESPGNYGLKDQILALKWIKNNIRDFGGDPDKITIFGESAGGASVSYLVQTPLTAGLFNRAISNSGNTLCQWALTRNPKRYADAIAKGFNIDTSNSASIVDGLRRIPYRKLQGVANAIQLPTLVADITHGLVFSPSKEPEHDGAVLSGRSHQLLVEHQFNKVSYLLGFNSKEAAGLLERKLILNIPVKLLATPLLASFEFNHSRLIPIDMNVNSSDSSTVGRDINHYYFKLLPVLFNSNGFESFVSDDQFVRPTREAVRLYSRDVDVYYYKFSYMGKLGMREGQERYSDAGVSHAEDLSYLFRINTSRTDLPFNDFITRYRLVKMWSNFAKYGNPTPEKINLLENVIWPITRGRNDSDTNLVYLDIGEDLVVKSNPDADTITMWNNLYEKYGNPPYNTY